METHLAPTVNSFVHKLLTGAVVKGYYFFVSGRLSERIRDEELLEVDHSIMRKFGADLSPRTRVRRKAAGVANTRYLRLFGARDFVLCATYGKRNQLGEPHPFFQAYGELLDERGSLLRAREFKDFRREALSFHGYSISLRPDGGRPGGERGVGKAPKLRGSVALTREEKRSLESYLVHEAKRRSTEELVELMEHLPYTLYGRVRLQLYSVLYRANAARKAAGLPLIPKSVLDRDRRKAVRSSLTLEAA